MDEGLHRSDQFGRLLLEDAAAQVDGSSKEAGRLSQLDALIDGASISCTALRGISGLSLT